MNPFYSQGLETALNIKTKKFIFTNAQITKYDVAPCGACRPWIFFINGVLCFLKINGSETEKEERWLEMPLQGENESRTSSPP